MLFFGALQSMRRVAAYRVTLSEACRAGQGRWYGLTPVSCIRARRTEALRENAVGPMRTSDSASGVPSPAETTSGTVSNASDLDMVASSYKSVTFEGQTYRTASFGTIRLDGDNEALEVAELAKRGGNAESGQASTADSETASLGEARDDRTALAGLPGDFFGIDAYVEAARSSAAAAKAPSNERLPTSYSEAANQRNQDKINVRHDVLGRSKGSSYIEEQYFPEQPLASHASSPPSADIRQHSVAAGLQPKGTDGPAASFIEQQYFGAEPFERGRTDGALSTSYAGACDASGSGTVQPLVSRDGAEQLNFSSAAASASEQRAAAFDVVLPGEFASPTATENQENIIDGLYFKVATTTGLPLIPEAVDSEVAAAPAHFGSDLKTRKMQVDNSQLPIRRQLREMQQIGIEAAAGSRSPRTGTGRVKPSVATDDAVKQPSAKTDRFVTSSSLIERLRRLSAASPEEYGSYAPREHRQPDDGIAPQPEQEFSSNGMQRMDSRKKQRGKAVFDLGDFNQRNDATVASLDHSRSGLHHIPLELSPRGNQQGMTALRRPRAIDRHPSDGQRAALGFSGKMDAAASSRPTGSTVDSSSFASDGRANLARDGSVTGRLRRLALGSYADQSKPQMTSANDDLGTHADIQGNHLGQSAQPERLVATAGRPATSKLTAELSRQSVGKKAVQQAYASVSDQSVVSDLEQQEDAFDSTQQEIVTRDNTEVADNPGLPRIKAQIIDWQNETIDKVVHHLKTSVLFQNDDLLAVNKPYGIASHGGPGIHHSIAAYLPQLASELKHQGDLHLAHRLDKDTTGVLLLAKTQLASVALQRMFQQRQVVKTYWALTRGVPEPKEGIIDIPLAEGTCDGQYRMRLAPNSSGHIEAVTRYKVLSHHGSCALVEVEPITGVKHQIRVHLSFGLESTILGDHKYSHKDKMAPQRLFPDLLHLLGITQPKVRYLPMHLHARSVVLPEFDNGRNLFIVAALPKHFLKNMRRLKVAKPPSADAEE